MREICIKEGELVRLKILSGNVKKDAVVGMIASLRDYKVHHEIKPDSPAENPYDPENWEAILQIEFTLSPENEANK